MKKFTLRKRSIVGFICLAIVLLATSILVNSVKLTSVDNFAKSEVLEEDFDNTFYDIKICSDNNFDIENQECKNNERYFSKLSDTKIHVSFKSDISAKTEFMMVWNSPGNKPLIRKRTWLKEVSPEGFNSTNFKASTYIYRSLIYGGHPLGIHTLRFIIDGKVVSFNQFKFGI